MLVVHDLSVAYGESVVLSNISIEVPTGRCVTIMGRNGVGKTTLLKSVMGVLRAKSGQILLDGKDITDAQPYERARAGMGYVPQGRGIFPYLTVHENLLMGQEAVPPSQRTSEAVDEMYAQFPALKVNPRKIAGTLSGGQQQQLALARALVRHPALVLLDEPTEGIQPSIVQELEELIAVLRDRPDVAVLLVEQFLDFALGVADYCYIMEKGVIVLEGPAADVDQDAVREYLAV